jgi:uncharacterized protein YndB with AHSA1/START domain
MTDARTDDRILSISRVIRTSPEELFDAWTDPLLLLKWWGPEGTTIPDYTFEVRVGGAWKTTMMNAAGDPLVCSGVYTVLDRPRRLGLTWGWLKPDGTRGHETAIDVTFEKAAGGTLMTLTQKTFQSAEQSGFHNQGWASSFNKLVQLFA